MTQTRLESLTISFVKRNAKRRGPTSSEAWNDTFDEISNDLTKLYGQWNNYLLPLTETLPDGTDDSTINAFEDGLDGRTIYTNSDATSSVATDYYSTSSARPYTIYEQFTNVYSYIDDINETLSNDISGKIYSASTMTILDSANLFSSENVEDALAEVMNATLDIDDYLPLSGGIMTGSITMAATKAFQFASGVQVLEGAGSPTGVVAAPVGSIYLRRDGGAGSTLYVKEAGAGTAVGWVAK